MSRLHVEISSDSQILPVSIDGNKTMHGEITTYGGLTHVFTFHLTTVCNTNNLFLSIEVPDLSRLRINGHKGTVLP